MGFRMEKYTTRRKCSPLLAGPLLALLALASCQQAPVDTGMLRDRVRNVLQMETTEFIYRDLVYQSISDSLLGMSTRDTRVLAEVKIHVVAGVDIREGMKISMDATDPSGPVTKVLLPRARILLVDADESSIRQFMIREYKFMDDGRMSLLAFGRKLRENKETIKRDALSRGILERAENNARLVVTKILNLSGISRVQVEFPPDETGTPAGKETANGN